MASEMRDRLASRLLSHYEQGLSELGFKPEPKGQISTVGAFDSAAAVWQMPAKGIYVVIDVNLDLWAKKAKVRILLIQNARLSIL
jgi:hypothetical protein